MRQAADGAEIVLSLPGEVVGLDAANGAEKWKCRGLGDLVYTSPVVGSEAMIAMSGYGGPSLALRLGGTGDVTDTHRLWLTERNQQRIGSGVILGEHAYLLNEPGVAECFLVATGEKVWEQRLGQSWSSIVHAAGRLYLTGMEGDTWVIAASPNYELLSTNSIGEHLLSTLAPSDGQFFLRTHQSLWCIGKK